MGGWSEAFQAHPLQGGIYIISGKKAKPGKVNIKTLGPWCVLLKPWEFRHLSCNFHYLNQNCFNCFYRTSCIKELSHHSYILAHQWNDQKRIYSFCIRVRYFQLLLKRLSNKFGPLKFLCFLFLLLSSSSLKYLLVNCIIYIYIYIYDHVASIN